MKVMRVSPALARSLTVAIAMTTTVTRRQVEALIAEIEAYLCAVDIFRAEGCEPCWRGDPTQPATAVVTRRKGNP
jgi:hypothetical protein